MDYTPVVEEILRRVQIALAEQPAGAMPPAASVSALTSTAVPAIQMVDLSEKGGMPPASEAPLYIKNLSLDAMAQLANGFCQTPGTCFVRDAFLNGKPVYTTDAEVALLGYRHSAAPAYYAVLRAQLATLEKSGLVVFSNEEMLFQKLAKKTMQQASISVSRGNLMPKNKRVITEQDVVSLHKNNISTVQIQKQTIVTDLAKEYAEKYNITLVREG